MREAVRKFLDSPSDFPIFEIAQTSIEVSDLFLGVTHQILNLFRSKTNPPKHPLVTFASERLIENAQTIRVFEVVEIFFHSRIDERHRLSKNLNNRSGP